jgi:hypothetical protein
MSSSDNGNSNRNATSVAHVTLITSLSAPPAAPAVALRRFPSVAALKARLEECGGSEDSVAVIRALAAMRNPAAIRVLASLLDSPGPIAEESIVGLVAFGEAAIPAMRACVNSLDYETTRHGHRVRAALGDEVSKQWLRDDDDERIAAYLEDQGLSDAESLLLRLTIANESHEEKRSA